LDNIVAPVVNDPTGTPTQQYWNPRNDPYTWQHMVNFTIGLGLTSYLAEAGLTWTGDMYGGSYVDIAAGTKQWPARGSTIRATSSTCGTPRSTAAGSSSAPTIR